MPLYQISPRESASLKSHVQGWVLQCRVNCVVCAQSWKTRDNRLLSILQGLEKEIRANGLLWPSFHTASRQMSRYTSHSVWTFALKGSAALLFPTNYTQTRSFSLFLRDMEKYLKLYSFSQKVPFLP